MRQIREKEIRFLGGAEVLYVTHNIFQILSADLVSSAFLKKAPSDEIKDALLKKLIDVHSAFEP